MQLNGKNKQWGVVLQTAGDLASVTQAIKAGKPFDLTGYQIDNVGGDGKRDFYMVTSGAYGQPLFTAEPDRALDLPTSLKYFDSQGNELKPNEKLGGFIIRESSGVVSYRYSFTNALKQGVNVEGFQSDGSFVVDGKTYWLTTLFRKDANRYFGYDGFFGTTETHRVLICEMVNLRF